MAIFSCKCPICGKLTPHRSAGVARDVNGRMMQPMQCAECKTTTEVMTGENGELFQENIDADINTEADEEEAVSDEEADENQQKG